MWATANPANAVSAETCAVSLDPARKQQYVQPGQRNELVRLAAMDHTYEDATHDIYDWPGGPAVQRPNYTVQARSLVVLFAVGGNGNRFAGSVLHEGLS